MVVQARIRELLDYLNKQYGDLYEVKFNGRFFVFAQIGYRDHGGYKTQKVYPKVDTLEEIEDHLVGIILEPTCRPPTHDEILANREHPLWMTAMVAEIFFQGSKGMGQFIERLEFKQFEGSGYNFRI